MHILITVSLFSPELYQNLTALNTLQNPFNNNDTLGFTNSSCKRLSLDSGTASFLTLQFLPQLQPITTNVSLNLFNFSNDNKVGKTLISSINTNYLSNTDVSQANWNLTSGTLYYLTIQPTLSAYVKIPWGSKSETSVILQPGSSCTTGQWSHIVTNNGAYLPIQMLIQSLVTPLVKEIPKTKQIARRLNGTNNATNLSMNQVKTNTQMPITNTQMPITNTHMPITNTHMPRTNTHMPITNTHVPTTNTHMPITNTHMPRTTISNMQAPTLTSTSIESPTLKLTSSPKPTIEISLSESHKSTVSFSPTPQKLSVYSSQQEASPLLIASLSLAALFGLFVSVCLILYLRNFIYKKQPLHVEKKHLVIQSVSPMILPMPSPSIWSAATDGKDTWYVNILTNEAVWTLPPGERSSNQNLHS